MPKSVTQYSLLISCPGDIKEEITSVEECVNQFNTLYSDALGIEIVTKHWRKNSFAQSGGKPQALLNKQFVNDCDAAVAILWTRFGTPTDEYGSGTEEEVEIMLSSEKQVFMYFSDKPLSPSQINSDEYKKVQAFKERYKDRGLYFTYTSSEDFKTLFFAHLSQYFLSEKRVAEVKRERNAELKLVGINAQRRIDDAAHVMDFVPDVEITKDQYIDNITSLIHDISALELEKQDEQMKGISALTFSFSKPVAVSENDRKLIQTVADTLKIDLSEDFFNLGNLSQSTIPSGIFGGGPLEGTTQEKLKYKKIEELTEIISKCLRWAPIETAFSGKRCIKLALQNYGTAIDEDVEITLLFPRNCLITLKDFPVFDNDEMGYLLNECDMEEMFGIGSTSEYLDYSASIINRHFTPHMRSSKIFPGYTPDYSDDYINELEDVFCYSVFEEGDLCIVKLKVEYIKHNTTIAFPSVIFIQDAFSSIDYTITSKNSPEVTQGKIAIE